MEGTSGPSDSSTTGADLSAVGISEIASFAAKVFELAATIPSPPSTHTEAPSSGTSADQPPQPSRKRPRAAYELADKHRIQHAHLANAMRARGVDFNSDSVLVELGAGRGYLSLGLLEEVNSLTLTLTT